MCVTRLAVVRSMLYCTRLFPQFLQKKPQCKSHSGQIYVVTGGRFTFVFRLKIKFRSTCLKDIFLFTVVTENKHIQYLECSLHNK
jgi:hypothetical protein